MMAQVPPLPVLGWLALLRLPASRKEAGDVEILDMFVDHRSDCDLERFASWKLSLESERFMLQDFLDLVYGAGLSLAATLVAMAAPLYFTNAPRWIWRYVFWLGAAIFVIIAGDVVAGFFFKQLRPGSIGLFSVGITFLVASIIYQTSDQKLRNDLDNSVSDKNKTGVSEFINSKNATDMSIKNNVSRGRGTFIKIEGGSGINIEGNFADFSNSPSSSLADFRDVSFSRLSDSDVKTITLTFSAEMRRFFYEREKLRPSNKFSYMSSGKNEDERRKAFNDNGRAVSNWYSERTFLFKSMYRGKALVH